MSRVAIPGSGTFSGLPRLESRRIATAIEVVRGSSGEGCPGVRHWVRHLLVGGLPERCFDESMGCAACGVPIVGMVLTSGMVDDVSCDDCAIEYVAWRLRNIAG